MREHIGNFFGVSWRVILGYLEELKDDWITPKKFSELHSMKVPAVRRHFANLRTWGYVKIKRIKEGKRKKRILYQISEHGFLKLQRIRQKDQIIKDLETKKALAGIKANNDKFPAPIQEMLNSSEFNVLWECMKSWDIRVPEVYDGYCKTTGNHVRAILEALKNGHLR